MEPDFKTLGYAWVDGDPRSSHLKELDPSRRDALAERLAEALSRRRKETKAQDQLDGQLVVSVAEDAMSATGLKGHALDQLGRMILEHERKLNPE